MSDHRSQTSGTSSSEQLAHDGRRDSAAATGWRHGVAQLRHAIDRLTLPAGVAHQRPVLVEDGRNVRQVFASGWPDPAGHLLLLTLTAPGDAYLPAWNALAGQNFSWLMVTLRRRYGDVQYGRATGVQKRGALHFHVLLRTQAAQRMLEDADTGVLRDLVADRRFGPQVTLVERGLAAAGYLAKSVSEASEDRGAIPWLNLPTGEVVQGNARYRPWSCSRRWGTTMRAIRLAQCRQARAAGS